MKKDELFIDGISRINVTGQVVRIEFGAYDMAENEGEHTPDKLEARHRMVMPLDGFIKAFELFERVINDMVDRKVLVRTEPKGDDDKPAEAGKSVSPNFS